MDKIWYLHNVNLFHGLEDHEIQEILDIMPVASYRMGEFLFYTGDAADCLFILQVGAVKVSYITVNGDEKILNVFQAGDIFGDLFLGAFRHRIGMAEALEDVVVCKLEESDFLDLIQRYPKVGLNFIRHQADERRQTMSRMHALMRMDAKHRLLGTLLNLSRRFCCSDGEWFTLTDSLTQEDLANMTGLNRSTVSSLINALRRDGVLGGSGRSLSVNRVRVERLLENAGVEALV